jgi:phospholipase/carboxylesterase
MALEFRIKSTPGAEDGSPVLVLLHGRGSDMHDLQGLVRVLPSHGVLVTPQAPHPGLPWNYGPGWAWYRYLGDDRVDLESLEQSLAHLGGFLDEIEGHLGLRPGPLVLGGFSQGGTTSLAYAMTHPEHVDGVIVLSGFLAQGGEWGGGPEALGDTPLFWGHGTQDPAVPHVLALQGRSRILKAGGTLTSRDYSMGHWVSPEEMEDLRHWLGTAVAGWPGKDEE